MADRRRRYTWTLTVLTVVSWPYRVPPLSWYVALLGWLTATDRRMAATMAVSLAVLTGTIAWRILHG